MSGAPEPNGWDKVIRAVSTVKTRTALAALVFVLLFFMFWIAVLLTKNTLQWVLSLSILAVFGGFAYLVVGMKDITVHEVETKTEPTNEQDTTPSSGRRKTKRDEPKAF